MRPFILCVVFLEITASAVAVGGAALSGASLQVASSFTDESTKKPIQIQGAGFLVRDPRLFGDRFFVVTASHVSQGGSTTIKMGDHELKILGRIADNTSDLELLEVRAPEGSMPLAVRDGNVLRVPSPQAEKLLQETMDDQHLLLSSTDWIVLDPKWKNKKQNWGKKNAKEISTKYPGGEFFISSGVSIGRLGDTFPPDVWEQKPQRILGDSWLTAAVKIQPGMSGSAFVSGNSRATGAYVQGVASHFSRDFNRSYFAPAKEVIALMEKYKNGESKVVGCAKWKLQNGLTYRDFCDGTKEVNFLLPTAGDGLKADGGDGMRADGGSQVQLATLRAGVLWKGEPVVAFHLEPKEGSLQKEMFDFNRTIYADRFALERLRELEKTYTIKLVGLQTKLVDLFKKNAVEIIVDPSTHSECKESKGTKIRLDGAGGKITVPTCYGDTLTFLLPATLETFSPILRAKGDKTGNEYTIDLRTVFFEDLSQALVNDGPFPDRRGAIGISFPGMALPREMSLQIVNVTSGREQFLRLKQVSAKEMSIEEHNQEQMKSAE